MQGKVKIELEAEAVALLLSTKALSPTDIRCLDTRSRDCIWQWCLHNCIHAKTCSGEACLLANTTLHAGIETSSQAPLSSWCTTQKCKLF